VLCIEDNPLNVALLRAIFDLRPSLSLVVAETGQRGLACVRAHQPDLVLIDINLPDMSGVDVFHQLRQMPQGRDALCIAMSADVSANPVQRARDEGFADFWPKPLDVASMLARLDEAIASLTAPA
jgi:CheY-like chemotaxis protein